MKPIMLWLLLAYSAGFICVGEEPQGKPTKEAAIAKAKAYLEQNGYTRSILESNKGKDLLNPENKVYSNSVTVSDDISDVRFHHNGKPYDSDSITFIVNMKDKIHPASIEIRITPGGAL